MAAPASNSNFQMSGGPGGNVGEGISSGGGMGGAVGGGLGVNQQQQVQQQQPAQQSKELNAATLCRFGQETVQEIISRTQEVFQTLRTAQPPDGKFSAAGMDRKPKFQDTLRTIKANFKRLRVIYEKIEENFPSDKKIYFESEILQKSESDAGMTLYEEKRNTEAYKAAVEEYRDIMEQVIVRNRHLKETIDQLRQIICDVNTMLSMRKE